MEALFHTKALPPLDQQPFFTKRIKPRPQTGKKADKRKPPVQRPQTSHRPATRHTVSTVSLRSEHVINAFAENKKISKTSNRPVTAPMGGFRPSSTKLVSGGQFRWGERKPECSQCAALKSLLQRQRTDSHQRIQTLECSVERYQRDNSILEQEKRSFDHQLQLLHSQLQSQAEEAVKVQSELVQHQEQLARATEQYQQQRRSLRESESLRTEAFESLAALREKIVNLETRLAEEKNLSPKIPSPYKQRLQRAAEQSEQLSAVMDQLRAMEETKLQLEQRTLELQREQMRLKGGVLLAVILSVFTENSSSRNNDNRRLEKQLKEEKSARQLLLDRLKVAQESSQQMAAEKESQLAALRKQLAISHSSLKKETEKSEKVREVLSAKIHEMQQSSLSQVSSLTNEMLALKEQLSGVASKQMESVQSISVQKDAMERLLEESRAEAGAERSNHIRATEECSTLRRANSMLEKEVERLSALAQRLEVQLEESARSFEQQLLEKASDHSSSSERCSKLEAALQKSEGKCARLDSRMAELNSNLSILQKAKASLGKKCGMLEASAASAQREMEEAIAREEQARKEFLGTTLQSSVRLCVVAPTVNVHIGKEQESFKAPMPSERLASIIEGQVLPQFAAAFLQKKEGVGPNGGEIADWLSVLAGQMQKSVQEHLRENFSSSG